MDEEGEDEDGKASNSSGDSIDKILHEMGEDDPPAPRPVTGSHSKDPVGPGEWCDRTRVFLAFSMPVHELLLHDESNRCSGRWARCIHTVQKWDQDGRNVRPRLRSRWSQTTTA